MKFYELVVTVSVFALLIPFSLSYAENAADVKTLFEKGFSAMQSSNFEDALSYFDQVLEMDPSNMKALNNKGGILIELDRLEEALPYIDQVLEMDPSNMKALNNKGVSLATLEQYLEAIAIFEQILEINPFNNDVLRNQYHAYNNIIHWYPNDSKYLMDATIEVRDSYGALGAFQATKKIMYLPHHLTDKYLDSFPVIENVVIDNQFYEKIVIVVSAIVDPESGRFLSRSNVFTNEITPPQIVPVLRAIHWGIPVTPGDTTTVVFTVFRLIE